jgi:hypothetical protein
MLRKLFGPKKEEVTAGYRDSVMRNIMFALLVKHYLHVITLIRYIYKIY